MVFLVNPLLACQMTLAPAKRGPSDLHPMDVLEMREFISPSILTPEEAHFSSAILESIIAKTLDVQFDVRIKKNHYEIQIHACAHHVKSLSREKLSQLEISGPIRLAFYCYTPALYGGALIDEENFLSDNIDVVWRHLTQAFDENCGYLLNFDTFQKYRDEEDDTEENANWAYRIQTDPEILPSPAIYNGIVVRRIHVLKLTFRRSGGFINLETKTYWRRRSSRHWNEAAFSPQIYPNPLNHAYCLRKLRDSVTGPRRGRSP